MGDIYGGHLVAKYLKEVEGVSTIFSLAGGHIDRIYDGCFEHGIRLIDVRHEQAASMMAHAWSIWGPQPGVCLVTAGPGFANALTGLINASLDNAPLVLISGTAPVRDWDRGALQGMNQSAMVRSVVKWAGICHDTKRIPEYIAKAFRHAVAGRPGPVFLEFPPDILNVKVKEEEVPIPPKGSRIYKTAAHPEDIPKAAKLINEAEKPVIIGGSGLGYSDCKDAITEFVNKTGIPFLFIDNGRGVIPDDHPLSLWEGGNMAMLIALSMTDLVVTLGIRYNWLLMFGQTFPQAKVVRVDIDATEIDRNRASDVGLVGDMELVLKQLNPVVKKRDHSAWLKTLEEIYLPAMEGEIKARTTATECIHPARLMELIRQTAPAGSIFVVDGGDTSYFGAMGLRATEKSGVIVAAGGLFGCLGTGLPFGISAKLARPDQTVIVVSGDGSFGLNAMEFDTAVRHNVPIVCVICNDQAWGMIKHGQEMAYGADRCVASGLGSIHYEKVVEALGGYGELVTKDEDIVPALKRGLASGKPSCINVMTDPCVTSLATLLFVDALSMEK